jgi:hypothetical protein
MSIFIYSSAIFDALRGSINFANDKFYVMLVDDSYKPNRSHSRRTNVIGEISCAGYKAGGNVADVKMRRVGDDVELVLGGAVWPAATITARGAVYYKKRGDRALEELIGYIDFGGCVTCTGGEFALGQSVIGIN